MVVDNFKKLGVKEVIFLHDECYGAFAHLAPARSRRSNARSAVSAGMSSSGRTIAGIDLQRGIKHAAG